MMKKLVRDKIPIILDQNKVKYRKYIVKNKEELKQYLIRKLIEEAEEFKENPCEEEIADIIEVIEAIIETFDYDKNKILCIKRRKYQERGGFKEGIIIEF